MMAVGGAAATATPKEVMKKLIGESSTQYSPEEVKFSGALGMLDEAYRAQPVGDIDIARMRGACEVLDEAQRFNTAFGGFAACVDLFSQRHVGPSSAPTVRARR